MTKPAKTNRPTTPSGKIKRKVVKKLSQVEVLLKEVRRELEILRK